MVNTNDGIIDLTDESFANENPSIIPNRKRCGFCNHNEVCIFYINVAKMIQSLSSGSEILDEKVVELSPQLAEYCKKFDEVVKL